LELLFHEIDFTTARIKKEFSRDPSPDELKDGIRKHFLWHPRRLILMLTMPNGTPAEAQNLLKQTKDRLNEMVKKTRFLEDELKRYLMVYDLRTAGLSTDEVILKIGSKREKQAIELKKKSKAEEDGFDPETINRNYRRCFAKAKKIIKNLEKGEFPGKY